jgi:putative tricarboxylic transport membrane protein
MEAFQYLLHGFGVALQPINLFYCFVGVLGGTLVGVLPAIGPVAAIALLLPTAYYLDPVGAIIMLVGVQYGAMYGGSTTSILVNVPGEGSSVVSCLDGYPMALQGRAGPALGIAAFGSFIAGTFGIVGLMLFAPTLARLALHLGSPEYFTLMTMALTMVTYMARGSMIKAMMMVAWGLILSTVGMDMVTTKFRFTYNLLSLQDGISVIPLVIGLFGLREVLNNFQAPFHGELLTTKIKGLFPTLQDWKDSILPIFRGGILGFFMGILPGISPLVPTFISYGVEKKLSKHPEKFGTGAIEGVAGPESCNNAAVCGTQVPLFSLGIPTNVTNSLLLAALIIFGMSPGPQFIEKYPDLFWGLIASMYIGNVMLLVLNLPLIPLWVKVLRIPFILLSILILIFCIIGVYSLNHQIADVYLLIIFGLVGFLTKKLAYEPAPLIMAFILGPMIERALRQSLIFSNGSFNVFITRPVAASFLAITAFIIVTAIIGAQRKVGKYTEKVEGFVKEGTLKGDRSSSVFGLLFGGYVVTEGFRLGLGGLHQPGPGFFPAVAGIFLIFLSAFLFFRSVLPTSRAMGRMARGEEERPWLVVYALAGILVYALIFEWLGFILSTFLLVTFLLRLLNPRKWWTTLLTAGVISLSAYAVFDVLLKSGLPKGVLEEFF